MTTHESVRAQSAPDVDLDQRLSKWVDRGLISADQEEAILAAERGEGSARQGRATGGEHGSLVTEALGYVGGVLILIAAAIIAGRYFDDLGSVGRLSVTAAAGAALVVAGGVARVGSGRPAVTGRLRSVLWLLGTGAVAGFLGLLASESFHWGGEDMAAFTAGGSAVVAAELWRRHRWFLQQAALVASLAVAAGTVVARQFSGDDGSATGLAVWGVGAVWLLLGWGRHIKPRYASDLLGGLVATVGAAITIQNDWGSLLGVATAAVLILVGVRLRSLVLLGVGSLATLSIVPQLMTRYFPDTIAAPLAVLVAGVVLVSVAVFTARRRSPAGDPSTPRRARLPGTGWLSIAVVAVAVTIAVVAVGMFGRGH